MKKTILALSLLLSGCAGNKNVFVSKHLVVKTFADGGIWVCSEHPHYYEDRSPAFDCWAYDREGKGIGRAFFKDPTQPNPVEKP